MSVKNVLNMQKYNILCIW